MYLYDLTPVTSYLPFFTLDYFSKVVFDIGDVVDIEIGKRKVRGIILGKKNIRDVKLDIRASSFKTKKIISEKPIFKIENKILEKLIKISNEEFIPIGELYNYLFKDEQKKVFISNVKSYYLTARFVDRIEFVRDLLKTKKTIFLIVYSELEKYQFKEIFKNESVVVLKPNDLFKYKFGNEKKCFVVERFNFSVYRETLNSKIKTLKLIYLFIISFVEGDKDFYATGYHFATDEKSFFEVNQFEFVEVEQSREYKKYTISDDAKKIKQRKKEILKNNFQKKYLNDDTVSKIKDIIENKNNPKVYFFLLHGGISHKLFCDSCKKTFDCPKCSLSLSLSESDLGRVLYCKNKDFKRNLLKSETLICRNCGGFIWNESGLGSIEFTEYLKNIFDMEILNLDESLKKISDKKLSKIFEENKNINLFVGSFRLYRSLKDEFDAVFLVSPGSITSQSEVYTEKVLNTFMELEEKAGELYFENINYDYDNVDLVKEKETQKNLFLQKYKNYKNLVEKKVIKLVVSIPQKNITNFNKLLNNLKDFEILEEYKKGLNYNFILKIKEDVKNDKILFFIENIRSLGEIWLH